MIPKENNTKARQNKSFFRPSFILTLVFSGLVFVLVLDLLGLLPLLAVLFFLLICASIGKLIDYLDFPRCFNILRVNNLVLRFCFLCVLGMQVVALVILLCRLFSIWELPVLVTLASVALIFSVIHAVKKRDVLFRFDTWSFIGTWSAVLVVLLVLIGIIIISDYMLINDQHYYFKDEHHPIYELNIARATDLGIPPADLSYQGKPLKFHFASSLLTSVLYRYFKLDPLQIVYRVFPIMSIILFIPLLIYLLRLCDIRRGLLSVCVLCVLFASPFVLPIPGRFVGTHFAAFPNVLHSLTATPSYTMGYLGFLAVLIAVIESVNRQRLLSLTVCILSAILLMSKGSFYIPLAIGVGIWSLHECLKTRTLRPLLLPISILVVSAPFSPFLAGAHKHNQWILVPDRLVWVPKLPDSILAFPLAFFASPFSLYGALGIVYISAFIYVWKRRKESLYSVIMLITSVTLVGCTIPLFVCEAVEANSLQFMSASFVLLWALFFRWISSISMHGYRQWIFTGILLCALVSQQIAFKMWMPAVRGIDANKLQLPIAARIKIITASPIVYFYTRITNRKVSTISVSRDVELAEALRYIKDNSDSDDVLLIGKHYEDPGWRKRKYIGEWFSKSFFRTAMSGRQTVIETIGVRGIGLEPDYNQRSLENLKFYYILVNQAEESLKGWHADKGYNPPPYHREARANLPYVRPLWIGGDNNWFVVRQSFPKFLESNWNAVIEWNSNEDNKSRKWLSEYLARYQIRFILFERGEHPREDLARFLGLNSVFEKGNVAVYEYKKP